MIFINAGDCTASIFFSLGNRLIAISARSACDFEPTGVVAFSLTGRRERVYRAPLPEPCFASLRSTSIVMPVYSEPSAHSTR
jgi:hypothetical protein